MPSNTLKKVLRPGCWLAVCLPILISAAGRAQEKPYFVTYSHDLEEPGNLEIETKTALAQPNGGNQFGATAMELEYGTRAWWTTELYLDGQATGGDSTLFTGWRLENRLRPLMRDHAVNPGFYVEYENTSGADKTILEVVGHDGQSGLAAPNGGLRCAANGFAPPAMATSSGFCARATWAMVCLPGQACPRRNAGR